MSATETQAAMQHDALRRAGVRKIFTESGSGVGPRPELQRAIASLRRDDVLVVWKLDRIARSLPDLLSVQRRLRDAGACIRSLTEPLDTTSPFGEFTFQVLGAVAQLERSMIRERVMAGQAAARARGKNWAKPRSICAEDVPLIVQLWRSGAYTQPELAAMWSVSVACLRDTIHRHEGRGRHSPASKRLT